MPLKLNLNIPNKAVHAFIGLVVVVALVIGVYAYTFPGGFIGHGADTVWIDTPVGEMTLQAAIDSGVFAVSVPFIPICCVGGIFETDSSGAWQCVTYTDPPFIPSCADDEILEASGGSWQCTPKEGIEQIVCGIDEYLQFDGSDWVCAADGACIPSSVCAAVTCVGEQCADSCGNLYAGTKTDGICCVDTSWSPSPSTVCSGTSFTQTSNCDRTRSASGTMTGGSCCTDTSWSPSPSTVCSGQSFTQTSNCGRTRSATGTQSCASICVAGSGASCVAYGGVWTGSQCCVVGASNCVAGSGASCVAYGGVWTGSFCCIVGPSVCAAGSGASCVAYGGIWTGSFCCVPGASVCAAGSGASCVAYGGVWTGSFCCVPGASVCASGSAASCVASGGTWTGSFCCV